MKIWELIQIVCKMDPNTEVLFSSHGFPIREEDAVPVERVYVHSILRMSGDEILDPKHPNAIVLSTARINYKRKPRKRT